MNSGKNIYLFIFIQIFLALHCDESLPPRNNPADYFRGSLSAINRASKSGESYLQIVVTLKNEYDETINAPLGVNGTLNIDWIVPPEKRFPINYHRTISISKDNLSYAKNYDIRTNSVRVDPGDSILFSIPWNYKTDDSSSVVGKYTFTFQDNSCKVFGSSYGTYRHFTIPQYFAISGKIQVFQNLSTIQLSEIGTTQCVMAAHNGEQKDPVCTNIDGMNSCFLGGF